MRIAFKPTSTIAVSCSLCQKFRLFFISYIGIFTRLISIVMQRKQNTVSRDKHETELIARGRHDPCVVPRGLYA